MKNKIETVISVLNSNDFSFIDEMNINTDITVINQCNIEKKETEVKNGKKIKYVMTKDRGLSRSRNVAINESEGDIIIVADDDLIYKNGIDELIKKYFLKYPDADILAFQVEGIEKKFKEYSRMEKKINYLSSLNICSVEMVLKKNSIIKNNIEFDELFGSGSIYKMGEENIFLFDCLKKGLNIYYIPECIAYLHLGNSTWFNGFDSKYMFDRGAVYTRLFGKHLGKFFAIIFVFKKYKIIRNYTNIIDAIKLVIKGSKDYVMRVK